MPQLQAIAESGFLADLLFEQVPEFVGLYDVGRGWFTRVNQAGCQMLGYASAQALYDDPTRTLRAQPFTSSEWQAQIAEVQRQGRLTQEVMLRRQGGDAFWAHLEMTSFMLADQPYLLVRIRDEERLHAAERNLDQSVRRFEAMFKHATIGIIVSNAQGDILLANQKNEELFGYPVEELLRQKIEVLVPDTVSHHHAQLRASFNRQPSVRAMGAHRNLLARRRDGSVFPVEISLSYFYHHEELHVVAYIIDITLKEEARQALQEERERVVRLNAELEQQVADRTHALQNTLLQLEQRTDELARALATEQELGELKSRFVSMASHEFRTPLSAVLTSVALLEKYTTTEQQDKRIRHLNRIRTSVRHLTDILEEFLSVGRIEEGRIVPSPSWVDLPALLREVVAETNGGRKSGQRTELLIDHQAPLWLDASLLRKVLVNLLSNALKYSGENTTVTISTTCRHKVLTISVQDQGIGISAEDQLHLFERFFRARNATNLPGTGLGLYIIARYLELMGGSIALQSQLEVGTTFTITVPYEDHPAD